MERCRMFLSLVTVLLLPVSLVIYSCIPGGLLLGSKCRIDHAFEKIYALGDLVSGKLASLWLLDVFNKAYRMQASDMTTSGPFLL